MLETLRSRMTRLKSKIASGETTPTFQEEYQKNTTASFNDTISNYTMAVPGGTITNFFEPSTFYKNITSTAVKKSNNSSAQKNDKRPMTSRTQFEYSMKDYLFAGQSIEQLQLMTQRPQTRSRILRIPKKKLLSSTVSTSVIVKDDEL